MGILAASGQVDAARLAGWEFAGELWRSGELRPVRGALAMALARPVAGQAQARLVQSAASAREAALVPDAQVYARGICWTWSGSSCRRMSRRRRPISTAGRVHSPVRRPRLRRPG